MRTFYLMLTLLDLEGDRGCSVQSGGDVRDFTPSLEAIYTEDFFTGARLMLHVIRDIRLTDEEVLVTLEAWLDDVKALNGHSL